MQRKRTFIRYITILLSVMIFGLTTLHAQQKNKMDSNLKTKITLKKNLMCKINQVIQVNDSLTITLNGFSHKKPIKDGPTKATAYFTIANNTISEEITISTHGIEGKSKVEDRLTIAQRYDTVYWGVYILELVADFNYGEAIVLNISILE